MFRNATFDNIAVLGRNSHLFLANLEKGHVVRNFYICDTTEESLDRQFDEINKMVEHGKLGYLLDRLSLRV